MFCAELGSISSEKPIKTEFEELTDVFVTFGFIVSIKNVPETLKLSNQNKSARVEVYLQ